MAYGDIDDNETVAQEAAGRIKAELDRQVDGGKDVTIANKSEKLRKELMDAWNAYLDGPRAYTAPYTAIVQSSSFGKRRLLHQLAHDTTKLYYALANWETVGEKWLKLFTEKTADNDVGRKLERWPMGTQKQRKGRSTQTNSGKRGVILAVDEARALLTLKSSEINYYRLLCRALVIAVNQIKSNHGIFAVLNIRSGVLDSSSRNRESAPTSFLPPFVFSHTMYAYQRSELTDHAKPQPWRSIPVCAYKSAVKEKKERQIWNILVGMGRPLWSSTFRAAMRKYDGTGSKECASGNIRLKGQLVGVSTFLELLVGEELESPQRHTVVPISSASGWCAATQPRRSRSNHPTLPMILHVVEVKNVAGGDKFFDDSAGVTMNPTCVFSDENTLSKKSPREMTRVYIVYEVIVNAV
ncbi:hypothetical protein GQ600_15661 [Phytophthora cactorum]|nr:hypothetical protein GQ600_15661 [Phytophthora cactorum]